MTTLRPGYARRPVATLLFASLAVLASGCDKLGTQKAADPTGSGVEELTDYGPCWPTYRERTLSASTNRAGQALMVAEGKPEDWTAEWNDDWRSLEVVDLASEPPHVRYLAHTWPTGERFQVSATAVPPNAPALGPEVVEQPAAVAIAANSDRFILATIQEGREGGYRYLYHGQVPPADNHELSPTNGLSRLALNDPNDVELIRSFELSRDGQRVAAVVGRVGELRIFDMATGAVTVYDLEDGEVKVAHEIPAPRPDRKPAYATAGVVRMAWSPDGARLALSRAEPGGQASLGLLQVDTGELTHVRSLQNSTAPSIVWSDDGTKLTMMYTPLGAGGDFGNTQFARVAAEQNAEDESSGEILRPQGYRTEPAFLNAVDDSRFVFQWEGGVWQMTVSGGDLSAATAARVTTSRQVTFYEPVGVAPELDLAAFRVTNENRGRESFGIRRHLAAPTCDIEGEAAENP